MASVGLRNDKLYFHFRNQGKSCKEYAKLENIPANIKRMRVSV